MNPYKNTDKKLEKISTALTLLSHNLTPNHPAALPRLYPGNKMKGAVSPLFQKGTVRYQEARRPQERKRQPTTRAQQMTVAPLATSVSLSGTKPIVRSTHGVSRISHQELLFNITGDSAPAWKIIQSFALNPGLPTTFPWLATQAQSWEYYQFHKLRFVYLPRCSANDMGSISMIPDYDASDSPPSSEIIASNYEDMKENSIWREIACNLKSSSMHPNGRKLVRTGVNPVNTDVKLYDAGILHIALSDESAGPIGKLWVEYDVSLSVPTLNPTSAGVTQVCHRSSVSPDGSRSLVLTSNPLGNATIYPGSLPLISVSGSTVTFNATGNFAVNINSYAPGATVTQTAVPALSAGFTYLAAMGPSGGYYMAGSGTTQMIQVAYLNVSTVGATMTISNTWSSASSSFEGEIIVSLLPAGAT